MWPLGENWEDVVFFLGGGALSRYSVLRTQSKVVLFCGKCFAILSHFRPLYIAHVVVSHILTVAHNDEELTGCVYTWFKDKRWCRHIWSCPAALLRCCSGNILTSCLQPMVDPRKKLGEAHQLIVAMPSLVPSWFMLKEIGLNPTALYSQFNRRQ